jgi:hypothetical protein
MDQRNAGRSRAPITAQGGWDSYTADHIALLDHLRIDRCHLYGQCTKAEPCLILTCRSPSLDPDSCDKAGSWLQCGGVRDHR